MTRPETKKIIMRAKQKNNSMLLSVILIVICILLQVTTIPDEGEDNFKMPRASVVHMTSTATRPHHMSQVHIINRDCHYFFKFMIIINNQVYID